MHAVLRFKDLVESRLVKTWTDVRNLVRNHDFPPGRMLTNRVRVWTEPEIKDWLQSRPVASDLPMQGRAKAAVGATPEARTEWGRQMRKARSERQARQGA
jgi:predicted DNA-binding transcriptional regulator AlpA